MIKRFLIAFVLLVIVCGGIVGFNLHLFDTLNLFGNKPQAMAMSRPATTVSTVVVKPVDWTPGIEAIGTVNSVQGVELAVETTGIVKEILFQANQKVAAGAVLVQLDDAVERADLEAQKAQAALGQLALNRAQELVKRGVGSEVTLDTAQSVAAASASQVAKLQAVLDQKQLKAPFDGTMGIPKIDAGQYLAPGAAVASLQDLDTMRVDFSVPEQQFPRLRIGQTVKLGLGGDDMPYTGAVRGIDPKIDPASRLVTVRAEVSNPDGTLTPGQFVQVRVELPEEKGVLALPQTALTTSLYGDFIFVVGPAKPAADTSAPVASNAGAAAAAAAPPAAEEKPDLTLTQVFVKPGRRNGGLIEILEGISAGDEVVTAGQNRLFTGMSVVVDNTIDPSKPASKQAAQQ